MTKKANRSSAIISLLLLLAFAFTIVPLDLFHHHQTRSIACKGIDKTGSCQHKLHISEKPVNCWLCGIHYDKVFTKPQLAENTLAFSSINNYIEPVAPSYFTKLILSSLRGPPVG